MPLVPARPLAIDQVLTVLAGTAPRIEAVTAGLTPTQLRRCPSPGEWSANDVLAHLRACADVWGDCITTIVGEDGPILRAVNPRTWITSTSYLELEFARSLRSFAAQRANLLAVLEALPEPAWARTARVVGAGAELERTVNIYAQRLARHERPHVKQIEGIVSAVGR